MYSTYLGLIIQKKVDFVHTLSETWAFGANYNLHIAKKGIFKVYGGLI